jgi:hypothetical protein
MERFYLSRIIVGGPEVKDSIIDFVDGVNIIYGPSNTGKSLILKCIDFMLNGKIAPFDSVTYGYDTITMFLSSVDGKEIILQRNTDQHYPVKVMCNFAEIGSTTYNMDNFDLLLLKLFNIESGHEIIKNDTFGTQKLTFRSAYHNFYLDEDSIISSKPSLQSEHSKTSDLTALYFLLTGDDLSELRPSLTEQERKKRLSEQEGVAKFLREKLAKIQERKVELEDSIGNASDQDIEEKIDAFLQEATAIDDKIEQANKEREALIARAYPLKMDMEEALMLKKRYADLESQYISDIKRLEFILDGKNKSADISPPQNCPFCGGTLSEEKTTSETIAGAAFAEMKRISHQLNDLRDTRKSLDRHITELSASYHDLVKQQQTLSNIISNSLMPKSISLKTMLAGYTQAFADRQEIVSLQRMAKELNDDAQKNDSKTFPKPPKFSVKEQFADKDFWKAINDSFSSMVKQCGYPGNPEASISTDTWDAVVSGKKKENEGKGYRAFLNTIIMFNILTFLSEHGKYSPHLLLLDSPILSLKERQKKDTVDIPLSMKESLFSCLISKCGSNQIIIVDNEIPENVNYDKVNLIEFTKNDSGRYGFLSKKIDSE